MPENQFWLFLNAIRKHWFAAMSGGFSVPFSIAAVYADSAYGRAIWGALAVSAFTFSKPYG